jgi:virulence-associated protein VagC
MLVRPQISATLTVPVIAKILTDGHHQSVRLPVGFRFEGVREVSLERDGAAVILRPMGRRSIQTLIDSLSKFENFPEREPLA